MKILDVIGQWNWQLNVRLDAGAALGQLYQRHCDELFRFAVGLCGRRDKAEDAIQEVFLRLSDDLNKLVEIRQPRAYLYRAVRHQVLKNEKTWEELPGDDVISSPSLGVAEKTELVEALRRLPEEQREVVFMKEILNLSFREISEVLEISLNTAASRHRYALQKLRNELTPEVAHV